LVIVRGGNGWRNETNLGLRIKLKQLYHLIEQMYYNAEICAMVYVGLENFSTSKFSTCNFFNEGVADCSYEICLGGARRAPPKQIS
jgi:hypothetical protein